MEETTTEALEMLKKKYGSKGTNSKEMFLETENEKLRLLVASLEDKRFNELCNHPNLKRVTTNERDGGFTFWF